MDECNCALGTRVHTSTFNKRTALLNAPNPLQTNASIFTTKSSADVLTALLLWAARSKVNRFEVSERSLCCSQRLHLFDKKYSKNCHFKYLFFDLNIFWNVIYSWDAKLHFQHHCSRFNVTWSFRNLICWSIIIGTPFSVCKPYIFSLWTESSNIIYL